MKNKWELLEKGRPWPEKRRDIARRIVSIIGKPPFRRCALNPTVLSEEPFPTYTRKKVAYYVERDEEVRAYILIPRSLARPARAVLCLHQTTAEGKNALMQRPNADPGPNDGYAIDLVQRGYVTLSPDHLCAGERIVSGYAPYDTTPFYRKHPGWSAVGKAVSDNKAALDYLCSLDFVDPDRIGCLGHSLGAHSSVFLAAFDKRVKVTAASCGLTTFAEDPKRLEWARDRWYVYMPRLRPLFLAGKKAPFDFHELVALIAPRAFLNSTALNDECFGSTDAVAAMGVEIGRVYRLLKAEGKFGNYIHVGRHSFTDEAKALTYAWFDRWL